MGGRGRENLIICCSCGRRMPKDKAVRLDRTIVYSTDLKTADDIKVFERRESYYCPSCGKKRHIYDKKKKLAMRKYNK
jgi:ribosomal protein S26